MEQDNPFSRFTNDPEAVAMVLNDFENVIDEEEWEKAVEENGILYFSNAGIAELFQKGDYFYKKNEEGRPTEINTEDAHNYIDSNELGSIIATPKTLEMLKNKGVDISITDLSKPKRVEIPIVEETPIVEEPKEENKNNE